MHQTLLFAPDREEAVELPELRSFVMVGYSCGSFLDSLSFPALYTLNLTQLRQTPLHHIGSFISRSSRTLVDLSLDLTFDQNDMPSILDDNLIAMISSKQLSSRPGHVILYIRAHSHAQDPYQENDLGKFLQICQAAGLAVSVTGSVPSWRIGVA